MQILRGTGTSSGIAMGVLHIISDEIIDIPDEFVSAVNAEQEFALYENAEISLMQKLKETAEKSRESGNYEASDIMNAHLEILTDPEIRAQITEKIRGGLSAAFSVKEIYESYEKALGEIADPLFASRAVDMRDIKNSILKKILKIGCRSLNDIDHPCILKASELMPSQTVQIDPRNVLAIVTENGGMNSHSSILARAMGIPAVAGIGRVDLTDGTEIIVNGDSGEVITDLDDRTVNDYYEKKSQLEQSMKEIMAYVGRETITGYGLKMRLYSNIQNVSDVDGAIQYGSEGIGLFRTEFLFMNREEAPSEEEQTSAYRAVAEKMDGKPVIIRTLDAGGDKLIPFINVEPEMNPYLGKRAIRICLADEELFRTQIRAILRASGFGKIQIMFPMISSLEELVEAKRITHDCMDELHEKGISFDEQIRIGMMIEVPSAAIMADLFANECDFFSIGTNDLTQYTLAVDRGNKNVYDLFNGHSPAVLRLIVMTVLAAHKAGIECGICGELAADSSLSELWAELEIDELSMSSPSIPKIRKRLCELIERPEVRNILTMQTASEGQK